VRRAITGPAGADAVRVRSVAEVSPRNLELAMGITNLHVAVLHAALQTTRRRWLLVLLVFGMPQNVHAQNEGLARNVVYLELLGNALHGGSVNYERMLTARLSARVGASPFGGVPVMVSYMPGRGHHTPELGAGLLLGASDTALLGTATLGYRYQRRSGGGVYRAGLTPLIGEQGVAPWFGVSIGIAF
jgi:hypothetical protein